MSSSENEFEVSEEESEVGDEEQGESEASDDEQQDIIKQQSEEQSEDSEDEEDEKKKVKSKISFDTTKDDIKEKNSKRKKQQNVDKRQDQDESEDSEDEQREEQEQKKELKLKIPFNTTKDDVKEKYDKRRGKSLCLLFPKKLPTDHDALENELKLLCDRIIKVRRPRQRGTRFCLVDFESTTDCQKAMKQLKSVEVDGKKLHVKIPRTDSEDYIQNLIDRRKKRKAEKIANLKLNKSVKESTTGPIKKDKSYTATLMIQNIPPTATAAEIKNHFPEAVEFQLTFAKRPQEMNTAIVTLPTPKDATKARRSKIEIGENLLKISFAGVTKQKKYKKNKTVGKELISPTTGPTCPIKERKKTEVDASQPSIKQEKKNKQKNLNKLKRESKSEPDERHEEAENPRKKKFKHNSENTNANEKITESPSKKCKKSKGNKEFSKPEINLNKPNQWSDERNDKKFPAKNFHKNFQNKNSNFNKAANKSNFNKSRKFDNNFKGGRKPFNKNGNV